MKSLYLECSAGISGDMLVGALIDLGADKAAMDLALSSMPVKGFTYNITRVKKAGISCCDFNVILDSEHENHDHDMGYLHGEFTRKENAEAEQTCACDATRKQEDVYEHPHMPENDYRLDHGNEGAYQDGFVNEHDYMHEHELPVAHEFLEAHQPHKLSSYLADHAEEEKECDCAHPEHHHHEHAEEAKPHEHHHHHEHRGLKEITAIINETEMTENARTIALAIFDIIAEAEAKAHDVPKDEAHFHEVGALDSIVDIIAIAVLYDSLGVDHGITSPLAEGRGQIRCQHGLLPIPVPAVANICSTYGLILDRLPCEGEFVTPTGAAAVVALCDTMIVPDRHMILGTGYGSGKRNYECPSILRAMLLDSDDYEYTLEEGTHKPAEQDDEKSCASGLDNLQKLLEVKFGYEEAAPETEPIFKLETNIDDTTGEISAPHKSPKRGVFQEVFFELYKIKPYLTHPNFHLLLLLIDLEEYRFLNGWSKDRKRGSSRSDRIPTALYAKEAIMTPSDYIKLVPDTVPARFTAKDYAKACHVTQSVAQTAANVLCHVGVIEHVGKVRNAYLYERCIAKPDT